MRRLSFKRAHEMQTETQRREVDAHNEPQPVEKRSIVIEPSSPRQEAQSSLKLADP